jgi:hypothetical protein
MTLRSFVLAVFLVVLATSATAQQASTSSQQDVRQEVEAGRGQKPRHGFICNRYR